MTDINSILAQVPKLLHRPYLIQLEAVRGCNMRCDFCANHALPPEREYMNVGTLAAICENLLDFGPKQKIQFAMRGEPMLHPHISEIVCLARAILPEAQLNIVSNGTGLSADVARELLCLGANLICIDCYHDTYSVMYKKYNGKVPLYAHNAINPMHYHGPKVKGVLLIEDLENDHDGARTFTNQCGYIPDAAYDKYHIARPVPGRPVPQSCTNLFRELPFHFDGTVPVCCKDWLGHSALYNIHTGGRLVDYWYSNRELNLMRLLLLSKNRAFWPCVRCTYFGGFRKGLLPRLPSIDADTQLSIVKELAQCRNLENGLPVAKSARRPRASRQS